MDEARLLVTRVDYKRKQKKRFSNKPSLLSNHVFLQLGTHFKYTFLLKIM